MLSIKLRASLTAVLGMGVLLAASSPASASKSPYPPLPEQRTLSGSDGGWTSSSTVTGLGPLCIAPLTCPTIENSIEPSDGIDGVDDGYMRVTASGLAEVTSQVTSTFESPTFTYRGSAGKEPDRVLFAMARRTDAAALIQILNGETYSVFLDDKQANVSIGLIEDEPLTNNETWEITTPTRVDKGLLTRRNQYSIRIVTEFEVPVGVIPTSTFDYDNVVMVAFKEDPPSKAEKTAAHKCKGAKRDLRAARAKQRKAKRELKKAHAQGNARKAKRATHKLKKGKRLARKAAKQGRHSCG